MLERIRAKNADTKTQYALIGAGLVTSIIGLVWISTLPARFAEKINLSPDEEKQDLFEESGISDVVTDTKSQLGNIIDSIPEEEVVPSDAVIDGALGTLGTDSVVAPESTADSEGMVQKSTAEVMQNSSESKIILIGTTTSEKSE